MKAYKKTDVSAFLENFQKRLAVVEKASQKLAEIERDVAQLEEAVNQSQDVSYKDDAKVNTLLAKQLKLKLCYSARDRQKAKTGEVLVPVVEMIVEGSALAISVLSETHGNMKETISAIVLPFCLNQARAEQVASQTDAWRGAVGAIGTYHQLPQTVRHYKGVRNGQPEDFAEYALAESARAIGAARKIEQVLLEACSKAPDLTRFLACAPAADEASADSPAPERSASGSDAAPEAHDSEPQHAAANEPTDGGAADY